MTSSRVIRGTRAKIFLYVCAVLVITGLIACYNSTLTQLDEVKKSNDICHQQQENLSTQLQVISEYKQKLEKSLKNEKAEHQQSKNNLEIKINEEKNRSQKLTSDALLKYNSLQQHFNLLQTQHDDFKEESSKTQKKQLEEINSLQSKLKEVEEELKKVKASKENIKTELAEKETENNELKNALLKLGSNDAKETLNSINKEEFDLLQKKYSDLQKKCGEVSNEKGDAQQPSFDNKPSEKAVLNMPIFKLAESPSSSTKAVPKGLPSQGQLNGARPLLLPSPTPETAKKPVNLKPPHGVVEPPENRENQNEQPQVQFQQKAAKVDDAEKDNVAQEVYDGPVNNHIDGLAFAEDGRPDLNLEAKQDVFLDSRKREDQEYKDAQQEEGGDDDPDAEYGAHQPREEAVRH